MTLFLLAIFLFLLPSKINAQISISEISPTTETEWIELYNSSDSSLILTGWKLKTETTTKNIADYTEISSNSHCIIETTSFLSNTTPKTVKLVNDLGVEIDSASPYPANLSNTLSWFKQADDSWSQGTPSKSNLCSITTPTSTPVPTSTNTPLPTNTPAPSNTSTPTIIPTPSNIPTSTPIPADTSTPTPTNAPISITIDNLPSSASLGSTFIIRFIVSNAVPDTDYYIKAFGGINDNYYLETQNGTSWYGFNAAWDNLPKFKSDSSGNINQLLFVRAKTEKEVGPYKVKVKIREPETESEIKYITITQFVPSPTPTKIEPTPTEEFIPTPEPLPTNTELDEAPVESAQVLGISNESDLAPNITSVKTSKSSGNIISLVLISVGGVLLLVPLLVSKIRDAKQN